MAGTLVAYGSTLRKRYGRKAAKVSTAVIDQGLFAGGNFIVNVLLARWMRPEQYGAFVVAYSWFLLPQNLYESILIEPLSLFGSGKYATKFRDYLGITFYAHVLVTGIMAICLGAAAIAVRYFDSDVVAAALGGAAIALPFTLTRWLTRRPFYVLSRPQWSAVGSFIYLLLALPGLYLLDRGRLLSPMNAMLIMALAALLSSIFLTVFLLKPQWNLKKTALSVREVVHDHLEYSRWSSATRILAWVINNVYFIALPIFLGLEGSGAYRALTNFVMPILMIKVALTTTLLPSFVRAFRSGGPDRLKPLVSQVLMISIALTSMYCLALVLFGQPLTSLLYYGKYDSYFTLPVLFTMGLLPVLDILNAIIDAALRSMGGVKLAFKSSILPTISSLTIGIVLILQLGIFGANIGGIITEVITLVTLLYFYRNQLREIRAQPTPNAEVSQPALVNEAVIVHSAEVNGSNGATPHKKVLLSAYACKPGSGSEGGSGWNVVKHTSQDNQTWVITRTDRREDIEAELLKNPLPNVHWIYYDLPLWMRFWRKGRRGQRVHYYLWQIGAYFKMRQICKAVGVDLIHHVSYKKYWNPSFLALLPAPFIWGPVGGGESMPQAFYPTLDAAGRRYEYARDVARRIGELDPFVRLTAHRTRIALATTPESAAAMHRLGAKDVRVLPGIALDSEDMQRLNALPTRNGDSTFRLVSVGWLLGWKGFHLGLQAFARLQDKLRKSEYWIIGEGPQQNQLKLLAESLGIQAQVRFLGRLPRDEVFARLAECDVLVHPSLHDSGGWVCLEAMAAGRPVLCLDIAGPREIVTEETGFKVRAYAPEEAIKELSEKMYTLAVNPDLRQRMAQASRQRVAEHFSWDAKCKQYARVYEEVVHKLQPQAQ